MGGIPGLRTPESSPKQQRQGGRQKCPLKMQETDLQHENSRFLLNSTRSKKTIVAALAGLKFVVLLPHAPPFAVMFGFFHLVTSLHSECHLQHFSLFGGTDFICTVNFNTPSNVMWPTYYQLKTSADIGGTGKCLSSLRTTLGLLVVGSIPSTHGISNKTIYSSSPRGSGALF